MGRKKNPRKSAAGTAVACRRANGRRDPFAGAKPLDLAVVLGGLPDDRSAEEILADLRSARRRRKRD